ncbi:hypothetical protein H257_11777 [Rhizophagus irregularis DAOM 181602=DAOM 197198]|nr:hypothetical protein H257_11777 [Rhizophagus irregularis DAOM 181602=DAOM 197198]
MYSHFLKRNGAPLTDNEKSMIINIHNYLLGDSSTSNDHHKLTLRKHIAEILGVAEGTVGSVVSDWYNRSDDTFTPHKVLRRPKFQPDENVSELLRTKILDANKKAEQLSTGERRNILHESPNNVAYRCCYLRFRFANLEGKNDVPRRPEVFLDDTWTWSISSNFGAIIVFQNGSSNKLYGELVPNSVHIWDPTIKPPGNWGRKRNNADEWDNIPDVVKDANIMPNQVDYHGNFNAEIFEDLFSTLCKALYEKYGPVNIHMDGASYHKRRVENIPTSNTKKQEIIDWLNAHNIVFSDELRRPELLELEYLEFDDNAQLMDEDFDEYDNSDEDCVI